MTLDQFFSWAAFNSSLAPAKCIHCVACPLLKMFGHISASLQPKHRQTDVISRRITEVMCQNKSAHNEQQMVLINLLFATKNANVPYRVNSIRFGARRTFIMIPYCIILLLRAVHTYLIIISYFVCFELWMCGPLALLVAANSKWNA